MQKHIELVSAYERTRPAPDADVKKVSLKDYINSGPVDLNLFFRLSLQLVQLLENRRRQGKVLNTVAPEEIYFISGSDKFAAWGFASTPENGVEENREAVAPYLSPETTGRTGLGADYRSNFYTLGVIFYEMLTGQLPFIADGAMEWAHTHLARQPVSPACVNPEIPEMLTKIIMKLLAKNPEDRYQSAGGLQADLSKCCSQWQKTGTINTFTLGNIDVRLAPVYPRGLYGRQEELAQLLLALKEGLAGLKELVCITGYPGMGKTTLANEFKSVAAAKGGFFISGKAEPLQQDIPYAPLIRAFGDLVAQILATAQDIGRWRKRMDLFVGEDLPLMEEIAPGVKSLLGGRLTGKSLPPEEAQKRFLTAIKKFIRVFASKEKPLIIFIDDLQWADQGSLFAIYSIVSDPEVKNVLLVVAYRENEIGGINLVLSLLVKLAQKGVAIRRLFLEPLSYDDFYCLLGDYLGTQADVTPLARILYRKTAGNPFYIKQLLQKLCREKVIYYDLNRDKWGWRLEEAEQLAVSRDVGDLLALKTGQLSGKTGELLQVAACLGNTFTQAALREICGDSPPVVAKALREAVEEGLLAPVKNGADPEARVYRFSHDLVKQAAYNLLAGEKRSRIHLLAGRALERSLTRTPGRKIFEVTDQLNLGRNLMVNDEERRALAGYNLAAARTARAATAYTSALNYLGTGLSLLPPDSWRHCYELTYELFYEQAVVIFYCGSPDKAERLLDELFRKARTPMQKAEIIKCKMKIRNSRGEYAEAVDLGLKALALLGEYLTRGYANWRAPAEFLSAKLKTGSQNYRSLLDLPAVREPALLKVLEILTAMLTPAGVAAGHLFPVIVMKMTSLTVNNGNSEYSAAAFSGFAVLARHLLGDGQAGTELETISLELAQRYNSHTVKRQVFYNVAVYLNHWWQHYAKGVEYLIKTHRYARESGDFTVAAQALLQILIRRYLSGVPLMELHSASQKYLEETESCGHGRVELGIRVFRRFIETLIHPAQEAPGWEDVMAEDASVRGKASGNGSDLLRLCVSLFKMQYFYLSGDIGSALKIGQVVGGRLNPLSWQVVWPEFVFYHSLANAAAINNGAAERRDCWRILNSNARLLKKWSADNPAVFLHKYSLVAAESERLKGRDGNAMALYDQAIRASREYGFIQHAALADELAAGFYFSRGIELVGRAYLESAYQGYRSWGAGFKAQNLKKRRPWLAGGNGGEEAAAESENKDGEGATARKDGADSRRQWELAALIKASRIMAGGQSLEQSFDKLMKLILEHTGAQRSCLLSVRKGEAFLEAEKDTEREKTIFYPWVPLTETCRAPAAVIRYTMRTNEPLILDYACREGMFAADPWMRESGVLSVLCFPLASKGKTSAVFYQENKLTPCAFSRVSREVLQTLCSQAAHLKTMLNLLEGNIGGPKRVAQANVQGLLDPLSQREMEILALIAGGLSNLEIAARLNVVEGTVKWHVNNIYSKLGVNRRTQAVAQARALGLLPGDFSG